MNSDPAADARPPRLGADRDPGDAWVEAASGERFWGRFGAAGLVVHDPHRGVLLQHRAIWSHHGGTWGIPGGALHAGEAPTEGALREALEEAGVPADAVAPFSTMVTDREVWRYTTVLARTRRPFEPVAGDAESLDLQWVSVDRVDALPLHPAFGAAWPRLRTMLEIAPVIIVDTANTIGARPNGWWRDRRGATTQFAATLARLSAQGIAARELDLDGDHWTVAIELVLEGAAREAAVPEPLLAVVAAGSGDDRIVERARELGRGGKRAIVVTSDRELAARVRAEGAVIRGVRWLWDLVDRLPAEPSGS